ncbi:MAG: hypothetical protein H6Q17_46 [Bacteroidetes bacterium]|jgi:hypothetical protein|nr:hypothetical protein [Bacteroidota bacterium]
MKSTALNHQSKGVGRSSSIYKKSHPDQKEVRTHKFTTNGTPPRDSEKETVTLTIVHNGVVWFDWG